MVVRILRHQTKKRQQHQSKQLKTEDNCNFGMFIEWTKVFFFQGGMGIVFLLN